jgi:hypothetical protein
MTNKITFNNYYIKILRGNRDKRVKFIGPCLLPLHNLLSHVINVEVFFISHITYFR